VNVAPVSARETEGVAVRVGSGVAGTTDVGAEVTINAKVGNGATVMVGNTVGQDVTVGGSVAVPDARTAAWLDAKADPGDPISKPNPAAMATRPTTIAATTSHLGIHIRDVKTFIDALTYGQSRRTATGRL
jgi:hypothetical protein